MKILYTFTQAFDPNAAGVQRTTYRLGKYFTEQGLEVGYFSTRRKGHVDVEFGQMFAVPNLGGLKEIKNMVFLKQVIKKWKPDIVINQMPYDVILRQLLVEYKSIYKYKLLGCLHNSLFSFKDNVRHKSKQQLNNIIFKLIDNKIGLKIIELRHIVKHRNDLKKILDAHDKYILLAPQNRDELTFFVKKHKQDKIIVIPNSIPDIHSGSIKEKKKIILSVGRLNIEQKRADLIIEFWKKAHKELPDWEFNILGDGPYLDNMKQVIKKFELPRVFMLGYKKPEKYYKEASFFMMTSAYEGFPNTILEANSYACPVLAFRSYKAIDWIVNDGKDALLSPPFDVSNLANNSIMIAHDLKKLKTMQLNALENAKRFTIDKVGQQWLELFEKIYK